MEDHEYYDNPADFHDEAPATSSVSLASVSNFAPITVSKGNSRFIRNIENRVELEALNARAAARLSGELIMNTATLYNLGEQVLKNSPGAQNAINHIINVYAAASAQGLAERWALWRR